MSDNKLPIDQKIQTEPNKINECCKGIIENIAQNEQTCWMALGVCGFFDKTTAIGRFGKDVLAAAVLGFPGMLLFGGKHKYLGQFVLMCGTNEKLIYVKLGLAPVNDMANIQPAILNVIERTDLQIKEDSYKPQFSVTPYKNLKFLECEIGIHNIKILGLSDDERKKGIKLISTGDNIVDSGFVSSNDDLIIKLSGNINELTPKQVVTLMHKGGKELKEQLNTSILDNELFRDLLFKEFRETNSEIQHQAVEHVLEWPESLTGYIREYLAKRAGMVPQMIFLFITFFVLTLADGIYLANGFIWHGDEPTTTFGLLSVILFMPFLIVFCSIFFSEYRKCKNKTKLLNRMNDLIGNYHIKKDTQETKASE